MVLQVRPGQLLAPRTTSCTGNSLALPTACAFWLARWPQHWSPPRSQALPPSRPCPVPQLLRSVAAPLDPLTIEGLEANVRDEDLRCPAWAQRGSAFGGRGGGDAPQYDWACLCPAHVH